MFVFLGLVLVCGTGWYLYDRPRYRDGIRYDPIEDDPDVQPTLRAAEQEARGSLKGYEGLMGYGNGFNSAKKQILLDKYGIRWRTPAELNPKRQV